MTHPPLLCAFKVTAKLNQYHLVKPIHSVRLNLLTLKAELLLFKQIRKEIISCYKIAYEKSPCYSIY